MHYKLSPSSLHLFEECPKCFWLQLNKGIKRPEGIFPSLPSGVDAVLKRHFDSFRDKGALPPELNELKDVKLFDDKELLRVWRNNLKGIQWIDEKGNLFRGAVDNLLQKGKKLIVLDYKTRGFPLKEDTTSHYKNQLDIYNFLLRKNSYETEDYSYLLFYIPAEVDKTGAIRFETQLVKMPVDVKNAETLFNQAITVLENEIPNSSEDCEWCKWKNQE